MTTSRRSVIQSASALGALATLPGAVLAQAAAPKSLSILVLGQDDLPVQYIDAADMCGWMVRLLKKWHAR